MWIYNEPTTPPTRTVDFPTVFTQAEKDGWVRDRIKLYYKPTMYQRYKLVIVRKYSFPYTAIAYTIDINKLNFYGGVIDMTGGVVYSFFDKGGNWLLMPEVTELKWHEGYYAYNLSPNIGSMPKLPQDGTDEYYATLYDGTYKKDDLIKLQIQYKSEEGPMDIVTGYIGEPHITAVQDRDTNRGIFGEESYILNVGNKLAAEVQSATEIRVRDGSLCHQGCIGNISNGTYDALTISNGSQGMLRHDLIVARYQKNADTHAESLTLVVIEGDPAASSPADPAYNEGDIRDGDSPVDMPLYRVNIDGINITSVTRLAPIVEQIDKLSSIYGGELTTNFSSGSPATRANMLAWLNNGVTFKTGDDGIWRIIATSGLCIGEALVSVLNNNYVGMIVSSYYTTIAGYYRYSTGAWSFSAMPTA